MNDCDTVKMVHESVRHQTAPHLRLSPDITISQYVAIIKAKREFNKDGVVSTTAFMALTEEGLDADLIIQSISELQFEETI